ncbi:MAG: N-6 DNA methylase [Bifidobacteriaceae bacterium]|nr:N-6 DNA methylase [Bifidobacteriaceae bacterium]
MDIPDLPRHGDRVDSDRPGEFFTPRNVCRMMVEMVDPGEADLVADPACGGVGRGGARRGGARAGPSPTARSSWPLAATWATTSAGAPPARGTNAVTRRWPKPSRR